MNTKDNEQMSRVMDSNNAPKHTGMKCCQASSVLNIKSEYACYNRPLSSIESTLKRKRKGQDEKMIVEENDQSNSSILDEWMTGSFPSAPEHSNLKGKSLQPENEVKNQKGGLGFTQKKTTQAALTNDKISKILSNQQKKGIKRKQEEKQESDRDLHGVVDDMFEESRTQIAKPANIRKDNTKGSVSAQFNESNKKQKVSLSNEKIPSKNEKKETGNNPVSRSEAKTEEVPTKLAKPEKSKEADFVSTAGKPSEKEEQQEESEVPFDGKRQRRRKKTRSKQKNIRKDTRSAEQMPDYLKLGNQNYSGRELTLETRKKLGMEI
jgi:hypothetical protein